MQHNENKPYAWYFSGVGLGGMARTLLSRLRELTSNNDQYQHGKRDISI